MTRSSKHFFFVLAAAAAFALPLRGAGQAIYRLQDESGKEYYSDRPGKSDDKPLALPGLSKENIDQKIQRIKADTPANCEEHGGPDCSKGADSDGSIICLDGFRGAVLTFNQYCSEVRLEAKFLVVTGGKAEHVSAQKKLLDILKGRLPEAFRFVVRNLSAVEARGVHVTVNGFQERERPLEAAGLETIPAYGLAEYSLALTGIADEMLPQEWNAIRYKVACSNCSTIRTKQD